MRSHGHQTLSRSTARRPPWRAEVLLALFLPLACAGLARGAEGAEPEVGAAADRAWSLGVAVGHGRQLNPFVDSEDIDINLVLDLAWYGERFFIDNGDFGFTLRESANLSVNAILTFDNERNYYDSLRNPVTRLASFGALEAPGTEPLDEAAPEREPAPRLAADGSPERSGIFLARVDSTLPKRRFAVNGGLELLYLSNWGDLQAQVLTDLSGAHDGHAATLAWTRPWYTESQEFALSLGMEWKSRDLVGYYYGVRPEEAFDGRPAYAGASGLNTYLRFSASHSFSRHWKLVSVLEREFLSDGIRRSPVIDRDTIDTFYLGLLYQF